MYACTHTPILTGIGSSADYAAVIDNNKTSFGIDVGYMFYICLTWDRYIFASY